MSNFLVKCASPAAGEVRLLKAEEKALKALDASSRASVRSAVIVLRDEDKAAARAHFRTPLVFSVHEAKGLEYPNVILFNLVSGNRAVYADLCRDVVAADLEGDELDYRRSRNWLTAARLSLVSFSVRRPPPFSRATANEPPLFIRRALFTGPPSGAD